MTGDLKINNLDAWNTWGVAMGEDFIQSLETPAPLKDYQSNSSRSEHGVRYVTAGTDTSGQQYLDERDVTLSFTLIADDTDTYQTNKDAFMTIMQRGKVLVKTAANSKWYRLLYTGKSVSYTLSVSRKVGTLKLKFVEPDPTDRDEPDDTELADYDYQEDFTDD